MDLHFLARNAGTTVSQTEKFLLELANLHLSDAAVARIIKRFPEFFLDCIEQRDGLAECIGVPPDEFDLTSLQSHFAGWLNYQVSMLWVNSTRGEPEWNIFLLRLKLAEIYNQAFFDGLKAEARELGQAFGRLELDLGPPHPDRREPIDFAMEYLWRNLHRAKRCRLNDCPAPYFLAKKKGQEYCSTACSGHAQRQQKLRWWAEHGEQRRKERKKK